MLFKPYKLTEGTQARKNPLILHKGSPLEKSQTIPYIKHNVLFTSPLNQPVRAVVSFYPLYYIKTKTHSDYTFTNISPFLELEYRWSLE